MEKEDGSYSYFTVSIYLSGMGEHTNTEHKPFYVLSLFVLCARNL